MLDALKRHCERLAADHLYCENVMDTYANARVSKLPRSVEYSENLLTYPSPNKLFCFR